MVIISVCHLKKYFNVYKRPPGLFSSIKSLFSRTKESVRAVDDISFEISSGELVGFIGPNGAGKTTTLKCLSGLLYPTAGKVSVLKHDPFKRQDVFLKQISLVMGQKNQLWWDLPAIETFKLNKEIYELDDKSYQNTLHELSSLLEIKDLMTGPVRQLSLGQRMRMELVAALLHRPKVLFLDEPTIGLDVVMQKKMRDFIAEYNHRYKSAILLTSHYMTDVRKLCRRVIIINHGKIIYDGSLDKLIEKYVDFKIISIVFCGPPTMPPRDLMKYGEVRYYHFPKLTLIVKKDLVKPVVEIILKKHQIEDLNIEEPEIEEVIRMVFERKEK